MRPLWFVLLLGCERHAPSCEAIGRHAQAHLLVRPTLVPPELRSIAARYPLKTRVTDEDRWELEERCEDWSADYRLCVIEQHGGAFRCGREDIVWATLPRVRRWLDEIERRGQALAFECAVNPTKPECR